MVLTSFFTRAPSPKKSPERNPKTPTEQARSTKSPSSAKSSRSPSKSPTKGPRRSKEGPSRKGLGSRHASRRSNPDDTHPLNLPSEERDKRISIMSQENAASQGDPMDVDVNMHGYASDHANGSSSDTNADNSPVDAPPKSPSPPPKPAYDPEECKSLGNKYFKAKDYSKAIAEYTKGE